MTVRRVAPVAIAAQRVPGSRAARRARGAAKDRGVLEQYGEGLSGEPARLHAAVAACRLVAAAKSAIAAEVFMNNVGW